MVGEVDPVKAEDVKEYNFSWGCGCKIVFRFMEDGRGSLDCAPCPLHMAAKETRKSLGDMLAIFGGEVLEEEQQDTVRFKMVKKAMKLFDSTAVIKEKSGGSNHE